MASAVPAVLLLLLLLVLVIIVVVVRVGLLLLLLLLLFWPSFVHTRLGCLVRVVVTVGLAAFFDAAVA